MSIDTRIEDACVNTYQETKQATASKTLNQQKSYEGMLESDESDSKQEMHPTNSNRTLNQQMSLEGMLEAGEKADNREMKSAVSNRTFNSRYLWKVCLKSVQTRT